MSSTKNKTKNRKETQSSGFHFRDSANSSVSQIPEKEDFFKAISYCIVILKYPVLNSLGIYKSMF